MITPPSLSHTSAGRGIPSRTACAVQLSPARSASSILASGFTPTASAWLLAEELRMFLDGSSTQRSWLHRQGLAAAAGQSYYSGPLRYANLYGCRNSWMEQGTISRSVELRHRWARSR